MKQDNDKIFAELIELFGKQGIVRNDFSELKNSVDSLAKVLSKKSKIEEDAPRTLSGDWKDFTQELKDSLWNRPLTYVTGKKDEYKDEKDKNVSVKTNNDELNLAPIKKVKKAKNISSQDNSKIDIKRNKILSDMVEVLIDLKDDKTQLKIHSELLEINKLMNSAKNNYEKTIKPNNEEAKQEDREKLAEAIARRLDSMGASGKENAPPTNIPAPPPPIPPKPQGPPAPPPAPKPAPAPAPPAPKPVEPAPAPTPTPKPVEPVKPSAARQRDREIEAEAAKKAREAEAEAAKKAREAEAEAAKKAREAEAEAAREAKKTAKPTSVTPSNKPTTGPGEIIYRIPTTGKVSDLMGTRTAPDLIGGGKGSSDHQGIDIAGKIDEPVYPIAEGIVKYAGYSESAGNFIQIKHSDGMISEYMHLNDISLPKDKKGNYILGEKVDTNTKLGLMGKSGHSSGSHLHLGTFREEFEEKNGKKVRVKKFIDPTTLPGLKLELNKQVKSGEQLSQLSIDNMDLEKMGFGYNQVAIVSNNMNVNNTEQTTISKNSGIRRNPYERYWSAQA